jgi:hypothetical protein
LLLFILGVVTQVSANSVIGSADSDVVKIKEIINKLFTNFYDGLTIAQYVSSDELLDDTDSTYLWKGYALAEAKAVDILYKRVIKYKFTVEYKNIDISNNSASLSIMVNLNWRYGDIPDSNFSHNVGYQFICNKKQDKWLITTIDTKEMMFDKFKRIVEEHLNKANPKTTYRQAVDWYTTARIQDACDFNRILIEIETKARLNQKNLKTSPSSVETPEPTPQAKGSFSYDSGRAIAYARKFAESPCKELFVYYQDEDCTNFVSQCVWAGYGIYPIPYNYDKLKSLALQKIRMVPGVWAADAKGALANWCRVSNFYDYVTDTSNPYGPKGAGINNESRYYNLSPQYVVHGCVLQFRYSNAKKNSPYNHSVIVSLDESPAYNYKKIQVCSHSNDHTDYPLTTIIDGFSGYPADADPCYMRKIAFKKANFPN